MKGIQSILIAAGLTWAVCSFASGEETPAAGSGLHIVPVERSRVRLTVSIAGTVTPFKTGQLTAQMPGRVRYIAGREGDTFGEGQVLVELDDSALLARRESAYAAYQAATAAIENALAQYQREIYSPRSEATRTAPGGFGFPAMMDQVLGTPMQDMMGLRDQGFEQYSDMVDVRTRLEQAQTSQRQAAANIREIDSRLRDTRSVAPFPGVIDKVYVEEGDTVQPGQPLVDFSQAGLFKVEADLPVHLVRTLAPGMGLPVKLDNRGAPIVAQVYRIHPTADLQRHTIRVELTLPEGTAATAGQYAELQITDTGADIPAQLSIPRSAVIEKGGMPLVFTVDRAGRVHLRVVRLGDELGSGRVAVLSGVREGDRIVDNPPPGLKAGQRVEARNAPGAEAGKAPTDQQQDG